MEERIDLISVSTLETMPARQEIELILDKITRSNREYNHCIHPDNSETTLSVVSITKKILEEDIDYSMVSKSETKKVDFLNNLRTLSDDIVLGKKENKSSGRLSCNPFKFYPGINSIFDLKRLLINILEKCSDKNEMIQNEDKFNKELRVFVRSSLSSIEVYYNAISSVGSYILLLKTKIEKFSSSFCSNGDIESLSEYFIFGFSKIITKENNNVVSILNFIKLWCDNLSLFNAEQVSCQSKLFVNKIFDYKQQNKILDNTILELVLKDLIVKSSTQSNSLIALRNIVSHNDTKHYIGNTKFLDPLLIESINKWLRVSDGHQHYMLFAALLRDAVLYDGQRLTNILSDISFGSFKSTNFARALFKVFVMNDDYVDGCQVMTSMTNPWAQELEQHRIKIFLHAIIDSFQASEFQSEVVVQGYEDSTAKALDGFLVQYYSENSKKSTGIVSKIIEKEGAPFYENSPAVCQFLSLPFLTLLRCSYSNTDKISLARFFMYFGKDSREDAQKVFCRNIIDSLKKGLFRQSKLYKFTTKLEQLYLYFYDNELYKNEYRAIYDIFINQLIVATRFSRDRNIENMIDMVETMVGHIIGVDKDWFSTIFSFQNKRLGEYESGLSAVSVTIKEITSDRNPLKWDTKDFVDRMFFLYSYAKHPLEEYQKWLQDNNPHLPTSLKDYNREELFYRAFEHQRKLFGYDYLSRMGYKCLQNSQLAAIFAATADINANKHFFAKVGTGQGKSLIIALIALHYAKKYNRKVHILTVYDHLAKRDFERFKPLYEYCGVKAECIDNDDAVLSDQAQIVYGNLHTFFGALYNKVNRRVNNEQQENDSFDYFDQDIVILDEFDSILFDADKIGNSVYDFSQILELPKLSEVVLRDTHELRGQLSSESQAFRAMMVNLTKYKLDSLYTNWHSNSGWHPGSEGYDKWGVLQRWIGSPLYEMSQGHFYTRSMFLNTLTYLLGYFRIIGFSGSIDLQSMTRLEKNLNCGKGVVYYDMPSFFGPYMLRNKCISKKGSLPARVWLDKVAQDVINALDANQPVLVFADINQKDTEWKEMHTLLSSIAQRNGCEFQVIDSESKVNSATLSRAGLQRTITLASHVAGRGADFVVQPEVIRQCQDGRRGLHVCITYAPMNDDHLDELTFVQMIGRTARMNNPGTHSIIATHSLDIDHTHELIKVTEAQSKYTKLMEAIYKKLSTARYQKAHFQKWIFLNTFISSSKIWPQVFRDRNLQTPEEQADFILAKVMQVKVKKQAKTNGGPGYFDKKASKKDKQECYTSNSNVFRK